MSDDYRNYSILVTQTQRLQVQVLAKDEASAQRMALDKALSGRFASTEHQTRINASWPQFEDENGPTVADEPGYVLRRGWFFVGNTEFTDYAMTEQELFEDCPEADVTRPETMSAAFNPYVRNNETVYDVRRRYGFSVRLDGDFLWVGLYPNEREARRAGRREVEARKKRKSEQERRAEIQATIQRMMAPGEADSLFKTKGGRWSVRSVIGPTSNPGEIELPPEAWSVDISMVKHLIATGAAKAVLQYQKSGAPLAITLTDAALRPF